MNKLNVDEETLRDLYVTKRKTTYEIAEMLNSNRKSVARLLEKFDIDINPKQRKFELLKAIPITNEQKELIVGTLLGDGCISKSGRKINYSLIIGHCEQQKDLVFWKKDILANFVNVVSKRVDKRGNSIMYTFTTLSHHELKLYYDLFYDNGKKVIRDELISHITPLSLATWIMDDGHLNKNINLRLHTEGFSEQDCEKLQYMLKVKFDIRCKVAKYNRRNKVYCYLSFNKENTIKTSKLTERYFIDCMKYKLYHDCSSTTSCQTSEIIIPDDDKV